MTAMPHVQHPSGRKSSTTIDDTGISRCDFIPGYCSQSRFARFGIPLSNLDGFSLAGTRHEMHSTGLRGQ